MLPPLGRDAGPQAVAAAVPPGRAFMISLQGYGGITIWGHLCPGDSPDLSGAREGRTDRGDEVDPKRAGQGVWGGWPPLPGTASRAGSLLCSQAWQAQQLGRPRKENEKRKSKTSGSSILCPGVPGPAQEEFSPAQAGWDLADGFSLGLGRLATRRQARRSYLIFWAHFMSSARGFSPVRPWMRSSRRRQKPIFSSG